jgi:hypothetical protein
VNVVASALGWAGNLLAGFGGWIVSLKSDEWAALGTMGTLIVALVAAIFVWVQVRDARDLRREQARPYVAAYLELGNEVEVSLMFLIIKNFGSTTARNISISSDKPMKRAWGNEQAPEDLPLFDRLPVLVPGQQWKTLFDWGPSRFNADLNEVYTLTVESSDSDGKRLRDETFEIDWNTFKPTKNIGVKTTHDIGKAVEKISRTMKTWSEGNNGPLSVLVRDGLKKDERDHADYVRRGWIVDEPDAPERTSEEVAPMTSNQAFELSTGDAGVLPSYPDSDVPVSDEATAETLPYVD